MNREQPTGVSKSKGLFKPWPPENRFRHEKKEISNEYVEIPLEENRVVAKKRKGDEITH